MDFLATKDSGTAGQVPGLVRVQMPPSLLNHLIFRGPRLNMSALTGVSGTRLAGRCSGMEPS
jgi:hypothetical protein